MTSRNYCITFWSKPQCFDQDIIRYAIIGEEICPETKKIHWQGYVELNHAVRISQLKSIFNDKTLHAEKKSKQSTRDQAREYCMKDGKYEEYGTWIKGQGNRSDLTGIVEELKEGKPIATIMVDYPEIYCRYRNGLKDIANSVTKSSTTAFRHVEVILLTGPTGCGKTRKAMEEAQFKIQGSQLDWWQDYNQEQIICIDEYSNDLKITELLALLDGYQLRLNVKGSHTYANWNKVYITTNLREEEIHDGAKPAHRAALFRRITKIVSFWDEKLCHEV